MSWDARAQEAARVLRKAKPLLDFDPTRYVDEGDVPALDEALGKVRSAVMEGLWAWDYYRMEASATASDSAALDGSPPDVVAWAFLRRLLARQ